ncbi:MAG: hypothetical protein V4541_08895 [Bacteroidota bacterium]
MKKLNLNISEEKNIINEELQQLINKARQFERSLGEEQALLAEIRAGSHKAIEELVKASSSMIYQFITEHPSNKHSIMQQFTFAQMHLKKLALSELNSTTREHYFRFQAFCIRQSLLALEIY